MLGFLLPLTVSIYHEQSNFAPLFPPTMIYLTTGPKTMELTDHGLKLLKLSKDEPSSFVYVRHFVTEMTI